jgi:hypothetical protein
MLRFFVLLLLIGLSFSCINVYKELEQSKIIVNEPVSVNIKIKNFCEKERIINVKEFFVGEVIFPKENIVYIEVPKGIILAVPPFLFWKNIIVGSKEERNITYIFKPLQVGLTTIQPTEIIDNEGNVYYSNSISFFVDCNHNKICEKDLGENYYDCPDDCLCDESAGIDCKKICKCPFGFECKDNECKISSLFYFILLILVVLLFILKIKRKSS